VRHRVAVAVHVLDSAFLDLDEAATRKLKLAAGEESVHIVFRAPLFQKAPGSAGPDPGCVEEEQRLP
jgi:hypothetical protein